MKTIGNFFLLIVFVSTTSASLTAQTIIYVDPNSASLTAQTIIYVDPNNAQQGQSLPVAITGTSSSFAQGSCPIGGFLTSITPDHARQDQALTVTITGVATAFRQGTSLEEPGSPSVTGVWLSNSSSTVGAATWWSLYRTLLFAFFDIPDDANAGKWDVHATAFCTDGEMTTYYEYTAYDAFTITPPCTQLGDLTCDGIVDFFDFAVVADNWLEGTPS